MDNTWHRICLTPTKNESWIIQTFAKAARQWATRVIVADQGSSDGTPELAQVVSGVDLVTNDNPVFDEAHRQKLLIDRARQHDGKRILIGLDADEALSANCVTSKEWDLIQNAKPGTILRFRWVNILPGFKQAWIPSNLLPCGFVDDGSAHNGKRIHSPRVPNPPNAPCLDLKEIVVLHFQYVLWDRVASKHRWYQAWEFLKHRQKGPLQIFREYNHMYGSWDKSEIHPIKPEWLEGYDLQGIDYRGLKPEPIMWWDREVFQMLRDHGPNHFRKIAIWDKDWNAFAKEVDIRELDLSDPRSGFEKTAHRLLAATQKHRANFGVRAFEHLLRASGW